MKYILSILSLIVLLSSCEQTITIPIPDNGRKITLNSILYADSSVVVRLHESKHILSSSGGYHSIVDADVTLFENNTEIGKLTIEGNSDYYGDFSYYTIDHQLKAGNVYSIEATTGELGTVISKCTIPTPVQIDNIKVEKSNNTDPFGYSTERHDFELNFSDPEGIENFYFLELKVNDSYSYYDDITQEEVFVENYFYVNIDSNDPAANAVYNYESGLIIADEYFDGKDYTFYFHTTDSWYGSDQLKKFYVKFHSISKEYYYYLKSFEQHKDALYDPFAEPVQVYSNIENGFGIMAGVSAVVDSVEVINSK